MIIRLTTTLYFKKYVFVQWKEKWNFTLETLLFQTKVPRKGGFGFDINLPSFNNLRAETNHGETKPTKVQLKFLTGSIIEVNIPSREAQYHVSDIKQIIETQANILKETQELFYNKKPLTDNQVSIKFFFHKLRS